MKQDELDGDSEFTKRETEDNLENGKEYVGITKTPYWNLMLDKQIWSTKEIHVGHRLFQP